MEPQHRVVVVGAGFGGMFAVKALKRSDVDITLIDRTNHHLFQPLLYQVATGILSEGEIAPATREVLQRQRNARVVLGEVTTVDLVARTVTTQLPDRELVTPYDSLVMAAGARTTWFGNDGFADHAPGLKTIDDALEVRGRIFGAFERAEQEIDPDTVDAWLTFVVVGAGPTGVELAGQIAELSRRTLRGNFRDIDPSTTRIVLLDGAPGVLTAFGERLSRAAQDKLERLGVEVELGLLVSDVDAEGVTAVDADGHARRFRSRTVLWAAGVAASPLGEELALQSRVGLDKGGRVQVLDDLTLPGHPEVYVIGDLMSCRGLPGVAQVAIQSGKHAAKQIDRRARGKEPSSPPFHYVDRGSMATISRSYAVASVGRLRLSGFLAWVMWLVLHLVYMTAFKAKVTTLLHWTVSFVGRGRAERTVTAQQVRARTALRDVPVSRSG